MCKDQTALLDLTSLQHPVQYMSLHVDIAPAQAAAAVAAAVAQSLPCSLYVIMDICHNTHLHLLLTEKYSLHLV